MGAGLVSDTERSALLQSAGMAGADVVARLTVGSRQSECSACGLTFFGPLCPYCPETAEAEPVPFLVLLTERPDGPWLVKLFRHGPGKWSHSRRPLTENQAAALVRCATVENEDEDNNEVCPRCWHSVEPGHAREGGACWCGCIYDGSESPATVEAEGEA